MQAPATPLLPADTPEGRQQDRAVASGEGWAENHRLPNRKKDLEVSCVSQLIFIGIFKNILLSCSVSSQGVWNTAQEVPF